METIKKILVGLLALVAALSLAAGFVPTILYLIEIMPLWVVNTILTLPIIGVPADIIGDDLLDKRK
mgnify:CR=1 FL=1